LGIRHSNRVQLQGLSPQLFQSYLSYLLGDFVWLLIAKDAEGNTVSCPSWHQLLSYEYQIRKKCYSLMSSTAATFSDCLKTAWNDPIIKERFFTTPLAYSATAPKAFNHGTAFAQAGLSAAALPPPPPGKGQGKGALRRAKKQIAKLQKGKGKGTGKSPRPDKCAFQDPTTGESICFGYNNPAVKCRDSSCKRAHVCGLCFLKHPMYNCGGNAVRGAGETQGQGD
jgi:hypothetical protein